MAGNTEWCICGHHDGMHDMEGDETQSCSAPRCVCQVFRPTGQGMPDMVLLNEHGTGIEEENEDGEAQEESER